MKDIFNKEFRSKLEKKDMKIYSYIKDNNLDMGKIMQEYTSYIYGAIKNIGIYLSQEDKEEIVLDVFLTLWNNQEKLDVNKNISSYIGGIAKNLIKKKYRNLKLNENILDYEEKLIDLSHIELTLSKNEKIQIVLNELEKLKTEDKNLFILYYYSNKKIKDICDLYHISESKVKSKLFRIRRRMRKILTERGYETNE